MYFNTTFKLLAKGFKKPVFKGASVTLMGVLKVLFRSKMLNVLF